MQAALKSQRRQKKNKSPLKCLPSSSNGSTSILRPKRYLKANHPPSERNTPNGLTMQKRMPPVRPEPPSPSNGSRKAKAGSGNMRNNTFLIEAIQLETLILVAELRGSRHASAAAGNPVIPT